MKKLVGSDIGGYLFNPAARTITLLSVPLFGQEQILTVTNTQTKGMLYCFSLPDTLGGTLVGNVLTLDYDTSAMSASDPLSIYVDMPSKEALEFAVANEEQIHVLLTRIANILGPIATQDAAQRQRVVIDAFNATLATITTLGTITNPVPVGNIAGVVDPRYMLMDIARASYNEGNRRGMIFT